MQDLMLARQALYHLSHSTSVTSFFVPNGYPLVPIPFIKTISWPGASWRMPIILATWEAEIRRITV
jgi:hypothetical protein